MKKGLRRWVVIGGITLGDACIDDLMKKGLRHEAILAQTACCACIDDLMKKGLRHPLQSRVLDTSRLY